MKTLINRVASLAAGALLLGSMAFAQSTAMKVKVPFAFDTIHGVSAPGIYEVRFSRLANDSKIISMTNVAGSRTVYLVGFRQNYDRQAPSLVFRCGTVGCSLSAVRGAEGVTTFAHRAAHHQDTAEIVVPLRPLNAD